MAVSVTTTMTNGGMQVARWTGDAAGGNGPGVTFGRLRGAHKTVQRISGAGTYTVEGSNDNATWGALGTAIAAINDAVCRPISENPQFIRVVTATAACTVVIVG